MQQETIHAFLQRRELSTAAPTQPGTFRARCSILHLQGVLEDVNLNQAITEVCRNAVRAFVEDRTDPAGRVTLNTMNNFMQRATGQEPWLSALKVRTAAGMRHWMGVHHAVCLC